MRIFLTCTSIRQSQPDNLLDKDLLSAGKMKAVLQIMENLEGELTRILLKEEDSSKIKDATAEAFEFYKTNFANRN